jgi:hypothetical protein
LALKAAHRGTLAATDETYSIRKAFRCVDCL